MKKLISVVFTIDRNLHFGQQCIQHLRDNGFVNSILKVYPAAPKGSSIKTLHLSIMANHYNVVKWFAETYDTKRYDLMVCEDDCEFVETNAGNFVHHQLDILDSNYEWSVCLLGQFACGPIFLTRHKRLTRSTFPLTSHCYVLNGKKLKHYLNSIDSHSWKKPWMTEGWLSVPFAEKFAIFPSVATQNRPIKDFARIPFMYNAPVVKVLHTFEYGMLSVPFVIVFVLFFTCFRKL